MKLNFLTDEIISENLNLDKFALCDGDGLYLVKQKATSRPAFITKFRIAGKIKTKTIGFYGNLTLNQARAERDKIKLDIKRPADCKFFSTRILKIIWKSRGNFIFVIFYYISRR